ncbi:hypothetical protein Leryth_008871 [Lithospermum erythrorhizon]|nr:hypothetical protein Leryth_008871 [Lithospermum erythrorhizon]
MMAKLSKEQLYKGVICSSAGNHAQGVALSAKEIKVAIFVIAPYNCILKLCKELIDGVVLVSRDAICASIKDIFEEKRSILEPAGALSLAGAEAYCKYYALKNVNVVAITSGANMNFDSRLSLQLSCLRNLAVSNIFVNLYVTVIVQVEAINITEFRYRYNTDKERALILYRQDYV